MDTMFQMFYMKKRTYDTLLCIPYKELPVKANNLWGGV